jgi:hypothetical protein
MNYVDALTYGFPAVLFQCSGDPTVYANLAHHGGPALPSQETLDAWIEANPEVPNVDGIVLTKYQFRKLFTLNERIAIDSAPINPNISAPYRAALTTMIKDLDLSAEVFLTANPDVATGVQMLEQLGLIGVGRAAQILANQPPQ